MKNRYQIVVTETIDSYIEVETEQKYTKDELKLIVEDIMEQKFITNEKGRNITFYPNMCCGRLYDIRKNGKDI